MEAIKSHHDIVLCKISTYDDARFSPSSSYTLLLNDKSVAFQTQKEEEEEETDRRKKEHSRFLTKKRCAEVNQLHQQSNQANHKTDTSGKHSC